MNPGIECTFNIQNGKIKLITLQPYAKDELVWKITPQSNAALEKQINEWVETYMAGEQPDFHLPLDFSGITPFTLQVLHHIQKVPFSKTLSYHDIAQRLNKPLAARAVGQACGRNPFPLVIPCHRILAKHNKVGGFSCGLSIKHFLLNHENIVAT